MNKNIIITLTILVISTLTGKAATLTQQADSAYMRDDFATAKDLYLTIERTQGSSSELLYNIGNCYYRLRQPGRAILYYERALRMNPSNADARANLEFVNTKITDEPTDRGMFISNTVNAFAQRVAGNVWASAALASFVLMLGAIALYIFFGNVRIRKIGFFGAIVLLGICVIANILASIATRYATRSNEAVVIEPSTQLSTSPRAPKDRTEEAVLLHEGTIVEIVDSITVKTDSTTTKWFDVKVDNSTRAWINGRDIERI